MNRFAFILIAGFGSLFLSSFIKTPETSNTHPFTTGKTIEQPAGIYETYQSPIIRVSDSINTILFYYSDIFTPVCTDSSCKPVSIRIYWDICGNFLAYRVTPQHPLTKKAHYPFTLNDYRTLYYILNNPEAPVSGLSKRNLVRHEEYQPIDGFTGATLGIAREVVVPEAAFTTFTLWHVANDTNSVIPWVPSSTNQNTDFWIQQFSNLPQISTSELTLRLYQAQQNHMLSKRAIWHLLINQLDQLTGLNALLVSNYLVREFPEKEAIGEKIKNHKELQNIYRKMMPEVK